MSSIGGKKSNLLPLHIFQFPATIHNLCRSLGLHSDRTVQQTSVKTKH